MNEFKRNSKETPLKELVDKFLKAYRLDGKMKELDVLNGWPEMMGVAVANRTEKLYIRNRILHVKMSSSVMRDELAHGKQIIILRVNEYAGSKIIDDVWFE
jgi:hypothetical protein